MMHPFYLPDPAALVSHQRAIDIKPELIDVKVPPIRQVTPEQRFAYSSSVNSDISRRPLISSTASLSLHSSRPALPAYSTTTLEPQYGVSRSLDGLRLQSGHVSIFPFTAPRHDSVSVVTHTEVKPSKKKREDRKRYSKRAMVGTTSSRARKSDNEAGNRYCQALGQANLSRVCREANPNIEQTAAPRYGSPGSWILLKTNNISSDVQQDGIEPSRWNKSSVNGSAILIIEHSNELLDDTINICCSLKDRVKSMSHEQISEELARLEQCLTAARNTRGEADWKLASKRMVRWV